jgi:hypothetical protein
LDAASVETEGRSASDSSPAHTSSELSEVVDAGDGVTLEFNVDPELNRGTVIASGPAEQQEKLERLAQVTGGPISLFKIARPGEDLPELISALDARFRAAPVDPVDPQQAVDSLLEVDVDEPPVVDFTRTTKALSAWGNTWCTERIDESNARDTWYHLVDWCLENRTGSGNINRTTVRQGFAVVQSYQGTVTLVAKQRPNSNFAWTTVGSYSVPQGNYVWVRTWSNSLALVDVRFETLNATGDTYNIAVQTAEGPVTGMSPTKSTGGSDYYHVTCECGNGASATMEQCLYNPTYWQNGREFPTANGGDHVCVWACGNQPYIGSYERKTDSVGCNASFNPRICGGANPCNCSGHC